MDLASFIANFQGGARPNRYRVVLNFPFEQGGLSVVGNLGITLGPVGLGTTIAAGNPSPLFSFMCRAASLPGSTVNDFQVAYQGRMLPVAGDRTFAPWNVTIYNDENFAIRNAFERWMDKINSHTGNFRSPTTNGYYADADVYQLSTTDAVLKKYSLKGIFPNDLTDIPLGHDQNDSIEEFSVNFAVTYWTSDTTS